MLEKIVITVGALGLGALLAWFFERIARPEKKMILLVPLILPALVWLGISGQLSEVSGPGGILVRFAAEAKSPVENFTRRGGLRPVFPQAPVTAQMALPAEARYVKDALGSISAEVQRGDITRRIFYWFAYDRLEPANLYDRIRSVRHAANDEITEYLLFGPAVGVIDCYMLDVDFVRRDDELRKTLRALASMPAEQRRAFLPKSSICLEPLSEKVPAVDALQRLDSAGHDEAIVVNDANGYVGITFRDTIVSALVSSLIKALADAK
jgi:hypothetical protein